MSVDAETMQTAAPAADPVTLTDMQQRVFDRVILGESPREIAARLGSAEKTVKAHLTAILKKYGCDNRARLISKYYREQLQ
jgi:DNA-binding CsgD family transcriptional regulator